ncbi:PREDICTED: centromere protein V isoform X1 [Theobroma cacao]|uniref:Centromere protein V isoform X1 n=1 Tax=Theobroma cacao TaxID=3641 RepID=A0AB32W854_THECC|nr:PREDICTED: centromere protein V isoform X1 [Theobroma cacao]
MEPKLVVHNGGCHCRKVRWHVLAPTSVVAWKCNCSDCSMRGNTNFVVPHERFELLGDSKGYLTTYTFGTHTAKHTFCKVCGIASFYTPRSNPDGIAVTLRCLDPGTLSDVEIRHYDGKNWENSYNQTGISLCSKEQSAIDSTQQQSVSALFIYYLFISEALQRVKKWIIVELEITYCRNLIKE